MLARMTNDFYPLLRLQDEMNRLFETFFDDSPIQRGYSAGFPSFNLWEDGDTACVEAELPGVAMEDLDVTVMGSELTISGERKIAAKDEANYQRRERALGRFTRTVTLPWEIDAEHVEAKLVDGVLTVTLPKSETAKPKKVKLLGS